MTCTKKRQMNMSSTRLPEKPVSAGAEWSDEGTMPIPGLGDLTTKMKHTLVGVDGGLAKIDVSGTIEMSEAGEGEDKAKNPMAGMMKITEGKIEGTVNFDVNKGLIKKRNVKTMLTMAMMGREIPTTQEETMELVDYKAAE